MAPIPQSVRDFLQTHEEELNPQDYRVVRGSTEFEVSNV